MTRLRGLMLGVAALGWSMNEPAISLAQIGYQRPPKAITDVLDAPPPPAVVVTSTREHLLLVQGVRYPAVVELAAPMLRLAGLRDQSADQRSAPAAAHRRHHHPNVGQ